MLYTMTLNTNLNRWNATPVRHISPGSNRQICIGKHGSSIILLYVVLYQFWFSLVMVIMMWLILHIFLSVMISTLQNHGSSDQREDTLTAQPTSACYLNNNINNAKIMNWFTFNLCFSFFPLFQQSGHNNGKFVDSSTQTPLRFYTNSSSQHEAECFDFASQCPEPDAAVPSPDESDHQLYSLPVPDHPAQIHMDLESILQVDFHFNFILSVLEYKFSS